MVYAFESQASVANDDGPYRLGLMIRETALRTEEEGIQDHDWHTQRGLRSGFFASPPSAVALSKPTRLKMHATTARLIPWKPTSLRVI